MSCMQLRDEVSTTHLLVIPRLTQWFRIIDPLASRCSKFRFKPLDSQSTASRLTHIAHEECIPVSDEVVSSLISTSQGDLRRSITYLQSASRLSSSTDPPTEITPSDIQEIAGVVPDSVINGFAGSLGVEVSNNSMDVDESTPVKAKGFDDVRSKVKGLMREGYSASQVLTQVYFYGLILNNCTYGPLLGA